jgi:recombination protein RecT
MADQTGLANRPSAPESGMERVKNYILSTEVKERFSEMMGPNGIYYLNQVMILVANSDELQKCTPKSILISAMRAASLRLSVDPGQGQAWIIPYKGVATFQLGYKGVYELALRTNLYRFINVIDVYEGETVTEDRMTGMHSLGGKRTGNKVISRMLYFKLHSGFEKTFIMTVEEIEAHARHYSQAYNSPRSKWNDPHERPKMEKKTVMVNGLRRWGRFNQGDADLINEIESEQGYIGRGDIPEENQVTPPLKEPRKSEGEIMSAIGFPPDPPKQAAVTEDPVSEEWTEEVAEIAPGPTREEFDAACTVTNAEGKRYGSIPDDKIPSLRKTLQAVSADPIKGEMIRQKLHALDVIEAWRAAHQKA